MRRAFTILEVTTVVLILGILAVAAPRFLSCTDKAKDNRTMHSLVIVRDAIELFFARNQRLPGADGSQATFKADLAPLLTDFPILPVGPAEAQNDLVSMDDKLSPAKGDSHPTEGWKYYYNTGVFIVNCRDPLASDSSINYDDL